MDQHQKQMFTACIESHRRMIKYHRRSIIDLSRKMLVVPDICNECIDYDIISKKNEHDKGQ